MEEIVTAGVPKQVAMELCGHKTRAIFDRYDIVRTEALHKGAEMLARLVGKAGAIHRDFA